MRQTNMSTTQNVYQKLYLVWIQNAQAHANRDFGLKERDERGKERLTCHDSTWLHGIDRCSQGHRVMFGWHYHCILSYYSNLLFFLFDACLDRVALSVNQTFSTYVIACPGEFCMGTTQSSLVLHHLFSASFVSLCVCAYRRSNMFYHSDQP